MKTQWDRKEKRNLRNIIFERDSYTCIFCEEPASDIHHVIKKSKGGRDNPYNLVSVCRWCHSALHGVGVNEPRQVTIKEHITNDMVEEYIIEYLSECYADDIGFHEFWITEYADMYEKQTE
jgi:hypothetical protein